MKPLPGGRTLLRSGEVVTRSERNAEHQRRQRARRASRTESQIVADRIASHPDGLKRCSACRRSLPFHSFPDKPTERDGLASRCFGCRPRPDDTEVSA